MVIGFLMKSNFWLKESARPLNLAIQFDLFLNEHIFLNNFCVVLVIIVDNFFLKL